jgi:hypothetical protein
MDQVGENLLAEGIHKHHWLTVLPKEIVLQSADQQSFGRKPSLLAAEGE